MRAIYLIARREYLSYVATWGFWLSLLSVPIFMTLGAFIPYLIESAQPTRYYTVIDETGGGLDDIIQANVEAERRQAARAAVEAAARLRGDPDTAREALAAFDADPDGLGGLDDALAAIGIEESASEFAAGLGRRVRVEAPASDAESLRPWLTGERLIDTPEGPRPLFAAAFIRENGESAPMELVYYSTNVTDSSLRSDLRDALGAHLRREALRARGLSDADIASVSGIEPSLRVLDPSAAAGVDSEVTLADRAPFILSLVLAFLLWSTIFSVANMLLTSLIEEKGGKVIELLLSSARFHEILIGKLAGVAAVSFTLFAVWGAVGGVVSVIGGAALAAVDPEIVKLITGLFDPGLILAAAFFFVVGYLMFGSIFLALGSLCESMQDAQTLMTPIILVLMAPLLILVFAIEAMDSAIVQAASWFPLWTPFIMMARLPSEPPLWEVAGAIGLMVATMAATLWGSSAIFRRGALNMADAESVKRFFSFKKQG
ncbi:ABC transporter permease [Marinicauda salina]|jgi:ABC-2 type transport system permease protein|uniref:ABC transporter permease n=1 Tax=Marinicauda salina TaxID=2135793 RepID=A0A2U2BXB6_9PROT|nr:ABC transporter permease [Marinicauda salina]PWE18656.1 ABC transporter permease [Marinicauda salina]